MACEFLGFNPFKWTEKQHVRLELSDEIFVSKTRPLRTHEKVRTLRNSPRMRPISKTC